MGLISVLKGWFPQIRFIAEDLGILTPTVEQLLQDSGWPGMRVLAFAFTPDADSIHLPHHHRENSICYTGTHDNAPIALWRQEKPEEAAFAAEYLGLNEAEGFTAGVIRGGMSGVSQLFIAQMQDNLGLGEHHRMNTPGTAVGNWEWRLLPGEANAELAAELKTLAKRYGRLPQTEK